MGIRVSNVTGQIMFKPTDIVREVEQDLGLEQSTIRDKIRVANATVQILQEQPKPKKQVLLGSNIMGYGP